MGCCASSSNAQIPVGTMRRRLSVGQVDDNQDACDAAAAEQDRGIITSLQQDDVMKLVTNVCGGASGNRKVSIGSIPDAGKASFANKTMASIGDELDPITSGIGFTCRKGLKPESPNQDSWSILKVDENFSIYGVYDGHGQKGHDVSNFVKENLPKLMIKDQRFKTDQMGVMLIETFKQIQSLIATMDTMKKLSAQMSGTTATVIIHDHVAGKLTVSHVADSTAVLGEYTDQTKTSVKARQLTRDHKPDLKDERARIEKAGGRVMFDGYANHRVYAKNGRYPGLNMSRCLGDLLGHQDAGCSCEPEIGEILLTPLNHLLLLCSDGVWEFINPDEAIKMVSEFPAAKAMVAAERLAKESWDRWMCEEGGAVVDDITVLLIHLLPSNRSD
mmetsp:Transcript_58386/g.94444  ORF Transcript_58386/g.94444 Transcript_58386/m.94444 type:complete len:388 (-) Transcript_58386:168-1331(-)